MRFITKVPIENALYANMTVVWTRNEDQTLWIGECTIWKDSNTKGCDQHLIEISQGTPLGSISVSIDPVTCGAWAMTSFPGYTITERDLFWASLWAVQCIRRKHEQLGEYCNHKKWRECQETLKENNQDE